MNWKRKDLLGIEELTTDEIIHILDASVSFKEILKRPIKKVPTLRGKTIVNFFFEPSTRTRISFELAEKRLSADTVNFSTNGSSVQKNETLLDTALNIEAMKIDAAVVRHSGAGIPHMLAKRLSVPVINAGDGAHEHPTQALLDMFTIREKKGTIKNLKVAIVGDVRFSRVARSDIWGLTKMGAEVYVVAPPTFIPPYLENMPTATAMAGKNIKISNSLDNVIKEVDVIMALRIQTERHQPSPRRRQSGSDASETRLRQAGEGSFFPSAREYRQFFGITMDRLKKAKKDIIVMHPGPINRGVEMDPEVADSKYSVILEQVTNGVAVRMAVLYILLGGKK
ncbi:MAG: aspartate carbamoyltransferase catalytic subunit [Candidatus Ratteibacteria bacterium]|nr:aspartate carbamoyltransferase catalytic subunit [Candidatus Ratteibacteria bacterium]